MILKLSLDACLFRIILPTHNKKAQLVRLGFFVASPGWWPVGADEVIHLAIRIVIVHEYWRKR